MTAVVVGGIGFFAGRKYEKMEAQKDSSDNFNMVYWEWWKTQEKEKDRNICQQTKYKKHEFNNK